jgi:hypothetical protein
MSMAVRWSRSRSPISGRISGLRRLGSRDAIGLGLGADAVVPRFGDRVGDPAAVGEGDRLLLGVRPQGQSVATDADGVRFR